MDSEDDMYDSDSSYSYEENDDDDDADNAAAAAADELTNVSDQQKDFTVLKEEEIRVRQQDDISQISTLLSIPIHSATTLLLYYNWNLNKVHENWFADEQSVRKSVGLYQNPIFNVNSKKKKLTCGICFDSCTSDSIVTTCCEHPFCITCWTSYISTSINDGRGCLSLKCPAPECNLAIGVDMIDMLASDEDKVKYYSYLLRSYVEDSYRNNKKWCPGPGCDCAVEYAIGSGSGRGKSSYDVSCFCSYQFCWNCAEDAHSPVDCDTVAKWVLKNRDESENTTWMLANTKPCPKCKRAIEKNQGCNHMTCKTPCGFHFCWLCLGDWSNHKDFYVCNSYNASEAAADPESTQRKMAKKFIERYAHYYERWITNEKSRKKTVEDLKLARDVHIKKLMDKLGETLGQFGFIEEAWLQIVECRRVLKWTYAYGYYIPVEEDAKKKFFEYLQGEAEAGLERLHHCAEKELQTYLSIEHPDPDNFKDFRSKLAGLTRVTRNYFENLVKALENGLSEVSLQGGGEGEGESSKRKGCAVKQER